MPPKRKVLPAICFAAEGEPHSDCQNQPFSKDANPEANNRNKIWIGYRHELDASYNGSRTFRQILAQAEVNLLQAMNAEPKSNERAQWLEAFPGVTITANDHIVQQLERGERAFKQAICQNVLCKKRGELLQIEWIPIKPSASSSTKSVEGFLVGYLFRLQGQEMISVCRNYYFDSYRFQREDGTVSLDMVLRTVRPNDSPQVAAKSGPSAGPKESMKRRRSGRLKSSGTLDNGDSQESSSEDEAPTTPQAVDESTARTFPGSSTVEPVQILEDQVEESTERAAPIRTVVGPLSTTEEYRWMICQVCHTYGSRVLNMPELTTHVRTLEQAVREKNRLALCHSFARIMTFLVTSTSGNAIPGPLVEEYESMVNSIVAEFGMDLLSRTEGTIFMNRMKRAVVADQEEDLSMAYAALRASMIAYAGRT
ncbi:hypothetical protein QM012_003869 [Aureobasidium pullulans]|uniref:Uncharacterized protein n=1 Tax=Aureobasidium pullulans TaxID=5580 RepID=A0ABR0T7E9_AURPU